MEKFKCTNCEYVSKSWIGLCPTCKEIGTFEAFSEESSVLDEQLTGVKTRSASTVYQKVKPIKSVSTDVDRVATGIGELDRVLGGGLVDSEVVLLGGQPGSGKSTLALTLASKMAEQDFKVLYASGEESAEQIGLRAHRLRVENDNILVVHTSSLDEIVAHIEAVAPDLFIVDSLQAVATQHLSGSIGSLQQSREAANVLNKIAKTLRIRALLINQVNKSGELAGPEAIKHVVDASLSFESDKDSPLKFLRASKNRFGAVDEIGIFQHVDTGLEEVIDPSGVLSESAVESLPGGVYSVISEGVRNIPVEIQSLTVRSSLAYPRRQVSGVDNSRVQIIIAILDKFCQARLYEQDVFVSTGFGVKVNDTMADLGVAASILSSHKQVGVPRDTAFIGELSLTGIVKGSNHIQGRVNELARLGFRRIFVPSRVKVSTPKGADLVRVETVVDLTKRLV